MAVVLRIASGCLLAATAVGERNDAMHLMQYNAESNLPADDDRCRPWCINDSEKGWAEKCGYRACKGCEDCKQQNKSPSEGSKANLCEGTKPNLPKIDCTGDIGEQSGTNVTAGYQGSFQSDAKPITTTYAVAGLCPVNVHWHSGTEHYSEGQYDAEGKGPEEHEHEEDEVRRGFRCHLYDDSNSIFTTEYDWKHCHHMHVGETYEIHWPHSKGGDCGTPFQYQTPFYDGVFCHAEKITNTAGDIGVQAQVFTVVNDESFFIPDLIKGMRVHDDLGKDIGYYTGSTTGTSVDNEICSAYSPITWQVDRVCHLVSASSFDKMCEDMKAQADDLSGDMHPHGARYLVKDDMAANNHQL